MGALCKVLGHRWRFTHITLPRQVFYTRCGKPSRFNRGGQP